LILPALLYFSLLLLAFYGFHLAVIAFHRLCLLLFALACFYLLLLSLARCCLLLLAFACYVFLCYGILAMRLAYVWKMIHVLRLVTPKKGLQKCSRRWLPKNTSLPDRSWNARSSPAQAPLKPLLKPPGRGIVLSTNVDRLSPCISGPPCGRGAARRTGPEELGECCGRLCPDNDVLFQSCSAMLAVPCFLCFWSLLFAFVCFCEPLLVFNCFWLFFCAVACFCVFCLPLLNYYCFLFVANFCLLVCASANPY